VPWSVAVPAVEKNFLKQNRFTVGSCHGDCKKKTRSERVFDARFAEFFLAFTSRAGRVAMNSAGVSAGITMGGEKEERMATITMAAATAGHAEGGTTLNAFDNALLAAGIGNVNLVKISSIVPPDVSIIELPKLRPGAMIPTAYAAITSAVPGETIAAAVGYARPDDPDKNGVIMEFHGATGRAEAEDAIRRMLEEAFRVRGEAIYEMRILAAEHTVERVGCAVAAVALFGEADLV
jgi:arginine decarboxylase